jgi:hypothetical protein
MDVNLKSGGKFDINKNDIRETIIRKGDFILKLDSGLGLIVSEQEYNKVKEEMNIMCDKCKCESCPCDCGCDCCKK